MTFAQLFIFYFKVKAYMLLCDEYIVCAINILYRIYKIIEKSHHGVKKVIRHEIGKLRKYAVSDKYYT